MRFDYKAHSFEAFLYLAILVICVRKLLTYFHFSVYRGTHFRYHMHMRKTVVGVMCPGDKAPQSAIDTAYALGKLIAQEGWILLSGGRKQGAMGAVNEGAKSANGLTVGIIPTKDNENTSDFVDISIITDMGSARNNINVLSSDALIIITDGMGAGTVSEAALALKAKKHIILLGTDKVTISFFQKLENDLVAIVETPQEAIAQVKKLIS
jgi:uncharacterized protein (TIGR00725 family)